MDILFIQRDALANSLLTNLLLAIEARKRGTQVGVLFTQEALAALSGGVFLWPRELMAQEIRYMMADSGATFDLPLMGRGQGRQVNASQLVTIAREAGVPMFACPLWTRLLGIAGKMPPGVAELDISSVFGMISETKTIVGGF